MVEIITLKEDSDNNFLSSFEAFANGLNENNDHLLSQSSLLSEVGMAEHFERQSNQLLSETSLLQTDPLKMGENPDVVDVIDDTEILLCTDIKEEAQSNTELQESSELRQNIDNILGDLKDDEANLEEVKKSEEFAEPKEEKLTVFYGKSKLMSLKHSLRKQIPSKIKVSGSSKRKLEVEKNASSKSKKSKQNQQNLDRNLVVQKIESSKSKKAKKNTQNLDRNLVTEKSVSSKSKKATKKQRESLTSNIIRDDFSSKSCMKIIPQTTKISFKPKEESESKSSIKFEGVKTENLKVREKSLKNIKHNKKQ